jgi:hypothetical protein
MDGGEGFGDLAEEEAAAAAVVLQDGDARVADQEFFAKGGVEGWVDTVGDENEVNIAIGEEGASLIGVGGADGVVVGATGEVVGGLVLVEEAQHDLEDLGVFPDDEDIDIGDWHIVGIFQQS